MTTISEEVKEIFDDPEVKLGTVLRTLATEFGEDATLKDVNAAFQANRPLPSHTINGETFVAGYRGEDIISEGQHSNAKLINLKQSGEFCKGMFAFPSGQFLYWSTLKEELKVEQIVRLAQQIGSTFDVTVSHDVVPTTGERHAKIVLVSF